MASFKETFKLERDKKGPGKTFTWTDKNGKTGTYTTNYAEEEKKSSVRNPNATSTAGKVKPKESVSGASRSTAGKVAAKESVSGASRSTAGKVKPKVDMPARPTGGAKARQIAIESATASNVASNKAATKRKADASASQPTSAKLPEWLYFVKKGDLQKMKDTLFGKK